LSRNVAYGEQEERGGFYLLPYGTLLILHIAGQAKIRQAGVNPLVQEESRIPTPLFISSQEQGPIAISVTIAIANTLSVTLSVTIVTFALSVSVSITLEVKIIIEIAFSLKWSSVPLSLPSAASQQQQRQEKRPAQRQR
jgi:hypothetical protein